MKNRLRKELKQKRENLDEEYVEQKSEYVFEQVINSSEYKTSSVIMSYCDIKNEVKTDKLNKKILEDNKRLVLPYIDREKDIIIPIEIEKLSDLKLGKYDILEPKKDKGNTLKKIEIDLVLVPAVGYDRFGNRIGFGGGYYDKFLDSYPGHKVGLAYNFQMVSEIKVEEHDIKIDKVFHSN